MQTMIWVCVSSGVFVCRLMLVHDELTNYVDVLFLHCGTILCLRRNDWVVLINTAIYLPNHFNVKVIGVWWDIVRVVTI